MNTSIWNKRIPTMLAIIILLSGIGVTTFLVNTGVITIGRASPSTIPQNIRITNISDSGFTISYSTTDPTTGALSIGTTESEGATVFDDRDKKTQSIQEYTLHHITVTNLKPQTTYYYKIISGQETIDQNGKAFSLTTPPSSPNSSLPISIQGNVIYENATTPKEALLFFKTDSSQEISTIASNGYYAVTIPKILTSTFSQTLSLIPETVFSFKAITADQTTLGTIYSKDLPNIPLITIGNNYDFTSTSSDTTTPLQGPGFPKAIESNTLSILTPLPNQEFTDQKPQLKGTALPNTSLTISLTQGQTNQFQITSDQKGFWTYRPVAALIPGKYTLKVTSTNTQGKQESLTRTFTVFASGIQVAQSATPSAIPVITITKTPTPSPTTSLPTPTLTIPTSTPTVPPTLFPTGSPTAIPSLLLPTPTVVIAQPLPNTPQTGTFETTLALIGAIGTSIVGIILFVISRNTQL